MCAFSVSGESANVNAAIVVAKRIGLPVIALVGEPESTTAELADHTVFLGSVEPGIAEDVASAVIHAMYCAFMYENVTNLPSEFTNEE